MNHIEKWQSFISKFFSNDNILVSEKNEKGYFSYEIDNYLNTNVYISDKYGFLTLHFPNSSKTKVFMDLTGFEYDSNQSQGITVFSFSYSSELYPCRVYLSGGSQRIISFYDYEELEDAAELFENRIKVFQNTMSTIMKFKIAEIIQK